MYGHMGLGKEGRKEGSVLGSLTGLESETSETVHIQGDRRLIEIFKRAEKIELLTAKMLNMLVFTVLNKWPELGYCLR